MLFHLPQVVDSTSSSSSESLTNGRSSSRDCLDELYFGSNSSSSWDSVACACPTSGTVLHFLSYSSAADVTGGTEQSTVNSSNSPLHLIAIHGSHSSISTPREQSDYRTSLINCRRRLAESLFGCGESNPRSLVSSSFEARLRGILLYVMCNVMGRETKPNWIFPAIPSTNPMLDFTPFPIDSPGLFIEKEQLHCTTTDGTGKLRELVLPFFPAASSLQSRLSQSSLLRPLPGLYQYSVDLKSDDNAMERKECKTMPGLIVRPLPAAQEDLRLSPPSLVFQCKSLIEAQTLVEQKLYGRTSKIGWRGNGRLGSLLVTHPSTIGLDIRIYESSCDEWVLSSSFDESQDSLLAGSLAELQSAHVVSDGKQKATVEASSAGNVGSGDCWVEFRSNMKHPLGFLKQFATSLLQKTSQVKVAKPPDLPYE